MATWWKGVMPPRWSKCRCDTITVSGNWVSLATSGRDIAGARRGVEQQRPLLAQYQIGVILLVIAGLADGDDIVAHILDRKIIVHHMALGDFGGRRIDDVVMSGVGRKLAAHIGRVPGRQRHDRQDGDQHEQKIAPKVALRFFRHFCPPHSAFIAPL